MTGASGFIATHVCKLAAEQTHSVRGTVRSLHNACKIEPLRAAVPHIELFEADLLSDEGWSEAMQGCEYVFHVASPFPLHAPADENDLLRPAVEGTLRVLRAAVAEASVKRVIVTSSVTAISAGHAATATLPVAASTAGVWRVRRLFLMVGTSANGCRYTRGLFCTNGFDQGCAVDDDAPIDATVNMPSATSPSAAERL